MFPMSYLTKELRDKPFMCSGPSCHAGNKCKLGTFVLNQEWIDQHGQGKHSFLKSAWVTKWSGDLCFYLLNQSAHFQTNAQNVQ